MNARYKIFLAEWSSRALAIIAITFLITLYAKVSVDTRLLRIMASDPNGFLLHERRLHSQPFLKLTIVFAITGGIFVVLVEILARELRNRLGRAFTGA